MLEKSWKTKFFDLFSMAIILTFFLCSFPLFSSVRVVSPPDGASPTGCLASAKDGDVKLLPLFVISKIHGKAEQTLFFLSDLEMERKKEKKKNLEKTVHRSPQWAEPNESMPKR